MRRSYWNIALFLCLLSYSFAIYEDEIGVNNWHLKNIGRVNSAEFIEDKIFVSTDNSIIALLERKTGDIIWRQLLPDNLIVDQFFVNEVEKSVITITKENNNIYNWNLIDGSLLWFSSYGDNQQKYESHQALFLNYKTLLLSNNYIALHDYKGTSLWNSFREYGEVLSITKVGEKVISISKNKEQLSFTDLDLINGKNHEELFSLKLSSQSFIYSVDDQFLSFVNGNSISIVELNSFSQHEIPLDKEKFYSIESKVSKGNLIIVLESDTSKTIIVFSNDKNIIQKLDKTKKISFTTKNQLQSSFPSSSSSSSSPLLFISSPMRKEGEISLSLDFSYIKTKNLEKTSTKIYPINFNDHGDIESIYCDHNNNIDHQNNHLNIDCLLVMKDFSLINIKGENKIEWRREESLSQIKIAEIIDIPPPISPLEQMLRKDSSNPFIRLINRIEGEFLYILDKIIHFNERKLFDHDQFGYHKIIVAITENSKVFAIATQSPDIFIWQLFFHNEEIENLFCLPSPSSICYLTSSNLETGRKEFIYEIDVFTGKYKKEKLSFDLLHVITLENSPSPSHNLLLIDSSFTAHLYPQEEKTISKEFIDYLNTIYYYFIDKERSEVIGYSLLPKSNQNLSFNLKQIWQITLPEQEIITKFATQQRNSIFSPIRIVGSTPLEKYLNQNLIAIGTLSQTFEDNHLDQSSVVIYLIDSVTGSIIYRSFINDAAQPLNILISENFITISYQNVDSLSFEISVIELFRDQIYWDDEKFSSFQQNEISIKQLTFKLPVEVVSLGLTTTRHGISPPAILLGTASNQVVSIERRILDALRPFVNPEQAEGLIPYSSAIRFYDRNFLSYNLNVLNIKGITSAPTDLESTSVVVAYGNDLFFTHTQPADAFDILTSDFDHVTLLLIVFTLTIFAIITSRMSSNRDLMKKWA